MDKRNVNNKEKIKSKRQFNPLDAMVRRQTIIKWHDFKTDGPPPDSRQVLITDGTWLGTAHFFHRTFDPPDYNEARECNEFVNQHNRIIGGYIKTEKIRYWADTEIDIELPN